MTSDRIGVVALKCSANFIAVSTLPGLRAAPSNYMDREMVESS